MNSLDQWGPWALDLDPGERVARTRALRAIVRLLTGPRGAELDTLLKRAETDDAALDHAVVALDRLASLDRRRVLSSYAGLARGRGRTIPPTSYTPTPRPRVHKHKMGIRWV